MIRDYLDFLENHNTIYFFDLDDTLVNVRKFEEEVIDLISENNIESLLNKSLMEINCQVEDLEIENGKVFINDPNNRIVPKSNWIRKGKRIYLITPDEYYSLDESLPYSKKPIIELYNRVENKAIITGRNIEMIDKIIERLEILEIEIPNWGIHCFPYKSWKSVPEWKASKIIKIVETGGFKKAKFFDDRTKWVKKVKKIVNSNLPDLEFESIKV